MCGAVKTNKQLAALQRKSAKATEGAAVGQWAVNLASQGSLVGKRRLDATANSQTRYCCLPLIVLINCCVSGTINYSVTRRRLLQLPSKAVAQQVLLMCPRILWLLLLHRFLLRHRPFCRKFSSKLLLLALLAVLTWLRYRARQNGMRTVAEIRAAEETDRAAARAREAVVAENHRSLMQVRPWFIAHNRPAKARVRYCIVADIQF